MSTTINTTTPLFEHGPTIDDLHADDTVWHIGAHHVDAYLEQLGDGPTRKQLKRAEQRCDDNSWRIGIRAAGRSAAGLPQLMTNTQALSHPLAGTYQMKYEEAMVGDYENPRYGWPGNRVPDLVAYTIHLDTIDALTRAQRSRRLHDAINSRRTPCVICGDHTVNLTCDTCRPVLEHAQLIATAEQPIDGKRTRLDAALDYARNNR